MRITVGLLMMLVSGACCAESGCFRSVGEAALRAGVRDEGGFRVEGVRRDVFSGLEWVRVVRCGRPEVPGVLVRGVARAAVESHPDHDDAVVRVGRPVLVAGDAVRVIWADGAARGELAGVAVVSGAVGDRVRVRLEGFARSEERLVAGMVLAAGVVELEAGR